MPRYANPGPISFDAAILHDTEVPSGAFVEFPFSVPELFQTKGRVPVCATFDGIPYAGSLAKRGEGHRLLISKAIRERLHKQEGATVAVTVELDEATRTVTPPADLAAALAADAGANEQWDALAFSHQREYVRWIEEAKKEETRCARVSKCLTMVAAGIKETR